MPHDPHNPLHRAAIALCEERHQDPFTVVHGPHPVHHGLAVHKPRWSWVADEIQQFAELHRAATAAELLRPPSTDREA